MIHTNINFHKESNNWFIITNYRGERHKIINRVSFSFLQATKYTQLWVENKLVHAASNIFSSILNEKD